MKMLETNEKNRRNRKETEKLSKEIKDEPNISFHS